MVTQRAVILIALLDAECWLTAKQLAERTGEPYIEVLDVLDEEWQRRRGSRVKRAVSKVYLGEYAWHARRSQF